MESLPLSSTAVLRDEVASSLSGEYMTAPMENDVPLPVLVRRQRASCGHHRQRYPHVMRPSN
jgi:hypothetical protein